MKACLLIIRRSARQFASCAAVLLPNNIPQCSYYRRYGPATEAGKGGGGRAAARHCPFFRSSSRRRAGRHHRCSGSQQRFITQH